MKHSNNFNNNFLILNILFLLIDNSCSQSCTSIIPKKMDDCFRFSTLNTYCCFFNSMNETFYNHCEQINAGDYLTSKNTAIFTGLNTTIDCGNASAMNNMPTCGKAKVSSKSDCTLYGTEENSCCYYNDFGNRGCVKYQFNTKNSVVIGNVILQCDSYILRLDIIIYSFILFILHFN